MAEGGVSPMRMGATLRIVAFSTPGIWPIGMQPSSLAGWLDRRLYREARDLHSRDRLEAVEGELWAAARDNAAIQRVAHIYRSAMLKAGRGRGPDCWRLEVERWRGCGL